MADKGEETKEAAAKAKGGLLDNKLVLLGIIVVLQAVMALLIIQFVIAPKLAAMGAPAEEQAVEESMDPGDGVIVSLNEMVVTLQGPRKGGYLKITIDLEVADQETAELVTVKMPKLRHIAIMALTTKSVDDLSTHGGKSALNAELLRKFGDALPENSLRSIFFSDLVIQ